MSKSNGKKKIWPLVVLFIAGFVIMMYPIISNYYYRIEANNQILEFTENAKKLVGLSLRRLITLFLILLGSLTLILIRKRKGLLNTLVCLR